MKHWFRVHLLPGGPTRGAFWSVIVLFLVMVALLGVSWALISNAIHRAEHNTASVTQLCHLGNQSRAQQIQLWDFVISISHGAPHETPAQAAQREKTIREFKAYLHKVFAPRDCAMLGQHHD